MQDLLRTRTSLALFAGHFFLLLSVSAYETLWLIGHGLTIVPSARSIPNPVEPSPPTLPALRRSAELRVALVTYLHLAGIEAGSGFFAPNVPHSYQLKFEVQFPDGSASHETLAFDDAESRLRIASLVDYLGRAASGPMREVVLKLLANAVWQQHPEATTIRALVGVLVSPTAAEFEGGKRETYELRYAYDFRLKQGSVESPVQ